MAIYIGEELSTEHSYEQIRANVIRALQDDSPPKQFALLEERVVSLFVELEGSTDGKRKRNLCYNDSELLREAFWDLFREGVITLGSDRTNNQYPWFKVTDRGRRILSNQNPYFFHDLSSYESVLKDNVPDIDSTTLVYLKEAMQAFLSGCLLSAAVMVGVGAEHSFNTLLIVIEDNEKARQVYKDVLKARNIGLKLHKFNVALEVETASFSMEVKDNLRLDFMTTAANLIRNYRNDSGHPSGKILSRDECFMLLHLVIPCLKKINALKNHYS